jgi:predicted adenine nucleotide alpha hydrolase (AANH) superfamily ATPase
MSARAGKKAAVLDVAGRRLAPTTAERAAALVAAGAADLVSAEPLAIHLRREVELPAPAEEPAPAARGRHLLMHVCCGPCATYPTARLRQEGFQVTAFWYNPNIQPFSEHGRRREALARFAAAVDLEVVAEPAYEMVAFLRAVTGHEAFRERCRICYRLRLERTAREAGRRGFDAFTTTLLISPYQDEEALRAIGTEVGEALGVPFYYERFRRGWNVRGRMAREYGLYLQDYCGCVYSEWERRAGGKHRATGSPG